MIVTGICIVAEPAKPDQLKRKNHIVTTIVVESKMASDVADVKAAVEIKNGKIPMTGYKTRDGN